MVPCHIEMNTHLVQALLTFPGVFSLKTSWHPMLWIVLIKTCWRNIELLQTCLGLIQLAFTACEQHCVRHWGGKEDYFSSRFLTSSSTPRWIRKLWRKLLCVQLLNFVELYVLKGEIRWALLSQGSFHRRWGLTLDHGGGIRFTWAEDKIRILKREKKNEQKYRGRNAQNIKRVQIVCDARASIDT